MREVGGGRGGRDGEEREGERGEGMGKRGAMRTEKFVPGRTNYSRQYTVSEGRQE